MSRLTTRVLEAFPERWRANTKEAIARGIGLPWDELARRDHERAGQADLDDAGRAMIEQVRTFTLTPPDRIAALIGAVDYLVDHGIEGDVVECGVWKGGSLMAAALRLQGRGDTGRDLHAFDTFTGNTDPGPEDVDYLGVRHGPQTEGAQLPRDAGVEDVRRNLQSTGYPAERLHLVPGDVAQTIPEHAPERIALLRLDTDWYESTAHELEHLFPRLAVGGVLIIDDYGHYLGARKATDEYFRGQRIFLQRVDYTARMAVKQAP